MKQIISALTIISVLASCNESTSGKREPQYTIARVKVLGDTSSINWIRLNGVEAKVYKVGDTVNMKSEYHKVADLNDAFNVVPVRLDSMLSK